MQVSGLAEKGEAVGRSAVKEFVERLLASRGTPLLVSLVAAVAFSIGLWRGLTIDEYTTWDNTRKDFWSLVQNRLHAGHLPTFFIIEHAWVRVVGDSEFALRLPSMAAASLAVGLFYALARRLYGPAAGLLSAVALATNQVTVWCAQNARPYAGALLCAIGVAWGIERWLSGSKRLGAAALIGFALLGLSFYAAFAISIIALAVGVGLFLHGQSCRHRLILVALLFSTLAVMFVPVWVLSEKQQKFTKIATELGSLDLRRPLYLFARTAFGDYKLWAPGGTRWVALALFSLCAMGAYRAIRYRAFSRNPASGSYAFSFGFLCAWVAVPPLLLLAAEVATDANILGHPRYLFHVLPPVALITGFVLAHGNSPAFARSGWDRLVGLAPKLALVMSLVSTLAWLQTDGDGPHRVAKRLLAQARSHRAVVGTTLPLEYEWRREQHPKLVPLYNSDDVEVRRAVLEHSTNGLTWVFIYNNKKTPLDTCLETMSLEGAEILASLEYADARAFLIRWRAP